MPSQMELYNLARQYRETLKRRFEKLNAVNSPDVATRFSNMSSTKYKDGTNDPRGVMLNYGESISESDLDRLIERSGGNPYARQLRDMQSGGGGGRRSSSERNASVSRLVNKNAKSLVQQLADEYKAKTDEANAANEARYQQGLGELSTLRERGMNEIANWGQYEDTTTRKNYDENIQNQLQMLQDRGLGNDTIGVAFQGKNEFDRDLALQGLSERISARNAEADRAYTGDIVNFVEKRNDIAPDMSQLYELAMKYGQSGDGQGFDGGQGQMGGGQQQAPQKNYNNNFAATFGAPVSAAALGGGGGLFNNPLGITLNQWSSGSANANPSAQPIRRDPEVMKWNKLKRALDNRDKQGTARENNLAELQRQAQRREQRAAAESQQRWDGVKGAAQNVRDTARGFGQAFANGPKLPQVPSWAGDAYRRAQSRAQNSADWDSYEWYNEPQMPIGAGMGGGGRTVPSGYQRQQSSDIFDRLQSSDIYSRPQSSDIYNRQTPEDFYQPQAPAYQRPSSSSFYQRAY